MSRINNLTNFKGQQYALKDDIIDSTTGNLKTELNPVAITNSNGSVNTFDYSKLKVIGDCALIEGADGTITLRIGPAVNSSLFNQKDGISTANVTYGVSSSETATISSAFSEVHGTSTAVLKDAGDTVTAKCGSTKTTATVAGNSVHFEDNANGKFKVYVASGKNAENEAVAYEFGPVTGNKTETKNGITLAITNWQEEPKKSSGANGYCANINFTVKPSELFTSSTDFKVTQIEQLEGDSVVATWTNTGAVLFYLNDTTKASQPTSASYTIAPTTKVISGVTYLTTGSQVTPTAEGLSNIAYPAAVTNKAYIAPVNGNWFAAYYETQSSAFTTWTDTKNTLMSLTATAKALNKGVYANAQLNVKGNNIYGSSTSGSTSTVQTSGGANVDLLVCDTSGYVDSSNGTISGRLQSDYDTAFNEANDLVATTDVQTYNGWIQYPSTNYSIYNTIAANVSNPDYSACTGDRYAYFKLTKSGTIMGGTVNIASVASVETELKNGNVKIELANNVDGSWMDLMSIGTTFSWGTSNAIGFSIPQASNYGNGFMLCKITMKKGATSKIKSISMA